MRIASAVFIAAALAAPPVAAQGVTLQQAIAEALAAEPALQAARGEIDAVRAGAQQTALGPNPAIAFEEREQTGGPDRQTAIALDWPLDLFRRGARIDAADKSVDRASGAVRDRERLLAAAVRQRYGEALVAARRVNVMDDVVAAARRTYELLASRAREGAAPPLDRDVALVELRRLEGERALEAGRHASALAALKALHGRDPSATLVLADSLETLTSAPALAAAAAAVNGERADIAEGVAAVAVAKAETALAGEEGKPEIGLFAGYMRMDQSFPQNGLSPAGIVEPIHGVFHNVAAGVRVSLPLFNRGQGDVAAARARELAAEHALAARRLSAGSEVAAATARVDAAMAALVGYADDTRALARHNLNVVRETYTLGRATLFDVLNAQRQFLDFEIAYTAVLGETFAALADLQRAKGAGQ